MALVFVERGYNDFTKSYDLDLLAIDNNMLKFNKRNTRTKCEICSELTIKTPERCQCRRSSVFVVNLEHISHFVLVFLLLNLSRSITVGMAS